MEFFFIVSFTNLKNKQKNMLNILMFICKVTLPRFCLPKNQKDNLFVIVFFPLIVFLYQSNYIKSFVHFFPVIITESHSQSHPPFLGFIVFSIYCIFHMSVHNYFILYLLITFPATNFTSPDYNAPY